MTHRQQRLDVGTRIRKDMRTMQGGARIPAALTRTGVFVYTQPDGTVQRELRLPEEVFAEDSLRTLETSAVTVGHPGKVTPDNWRALSVGHPTNVRRDGQFVASDLVINDKTTLARVDAGELVELSCGYDCVVEMRSGVHDGEAYDAIQRNIRYNHVGLGPDGWGRAGSSVRLRLDGGDVSVAYTPGMPDTDKDLQSRLDALTTDFNAMRAEKDKLQARLDASENSVTKLTTENAELKKQLAGATSTERIDARIKERMAVIDGARLLHGKTDVDVAKSDREIMVAAIAARSPDFKADGRSDDYVQARFDAELEQAKRAGASLAMLNTQTRSPKDDAADDPLAAAEAEFRKDAATAFERSFGSAPTSNGEN